MRKVLFHQFYLGDVEDPQLYAAAPLLEWEKTEQGQWVMKHAHDPTFHIHPDPNTFGYRVGISGELEEQDEVYYRLKYGFLSVHC
jgi:hypothetical protein